MGVTKAEGAVFAVTGATGRLGSRLCARLEELGASVLPLVLPGYPQVSRTGSWHAQAPPVPVRRTSDLDALPKPDYALHLHWRVDRTLPLADQVINEIEWNVRGPSFLWEWLRDLEVRRFVNCSSTAVFGAQRQATLSPDSTPMPTSPYGIAKLAGEHMFAALLSSPSTHVTHVRLGPVTSPGDHPTRLVSRLAASAFDREPIRLDGDHRSSLLYVDEAIDWLVSAALHADRDHFLCVGSQMTVGEIARLFESVAGMPLQAQLIEEGEPVGARFETNLESLPGDFVRRFGPADALRAVIDAESARREAPGAP